MRRPDGRFSARGIALIALTLALLANIVNILSDRSAQYNNCIKIELLKDRTRGVLEDSKTDLENGIQDDAFMRVYGTEEVKVEDGTQPLWLIRKNKAIADIDRQIVKFERDDCGPRWLFP